MSPNDLATPEVPITEQGSGEVERETDPALQSIDVGVERKKTPITVERVFWGESDFEKAKEVEYNVFLGEHYTNEQGGKGLGEYEDYESRSTFLVARNEAREIVGVLREITSQSESWDEAIEAFREGGSRMATTGFKTLDDFPIESDWVEYFQECSPQTITEIGTIAVPKEHRHSKLLITAQLFHEFYISALEAGRTNVIASLDKRLVRGYRPLFNLQEMGPTFDYMGSDTTPIFIDLEGAAHYLQGKENQTYYQTMVEGNFSA